MLICLISVCFGCSIGKLLTALASDRKSNLPVELRDHIRTFQQYFFALVPDDKAIKASVTRALYLADESAKKQYDNFQENGFTITSLRQIYPKKLPWTVYSLMSTVFHIPSGALLRKN